MRELPASAALVWLSLMSAAGLSAQAPCSGGRVYGSVIDPSGAAVPGAPIYVQGGPATTSDAAGGYLLACVAAGSALLHARAPGFAEVDTSVIVRSGAAVKLDLVLPLATVQQQVEVGAEPTTFGDGSTLLSGQQMQALADDPDELLQQLQMLGSEGGGGSSTKIRVDGFENGSTLPPKSAIAAVRINPDLYSSEYEFPPYSGAQVEIITKPGAERVHGGFFLSDSESSLNANDPFSTAATPASRRRYGGELTGPILAGRTGYSVALEKRDINEFNVVNAITLDSGGKEVPLKQSVPAPERLWVGLARNDWQITPKDIAAISFSANSNKVSNQGVGGLVLAEAGYGSLVSEYDLRFSNTETLGANAVHETRVGYSWKRTAETALSAAPSLQVAGYFTGGGSTAGNLDTRERDLEVDDDLLMTRGTHSLKFGLQAFGSFSTTPTRTPLTARMSSAAAARPCSMRPTHRQAR